MTNAREQLRPAPATITQHSHDALDESVAAARRERAREKRERTSRVDVIRIEETALAVALRLADGDASRLTLNRDGTVTVRNRGKGDR